jgi:hypothetical protein
VARSSAHGQMTSGPAGDDAATTQTILSATIFVYEDKEAMYLRSPLSLNGVWRARDVIDAQLTFINT